MNTVPPPSRTLSVTVNVVIGFAVAVVTFAIGVRVANSVVEGIDDEYRSHVSQIAAGRAGAVAAQLSQLQTATGLAASLLDPTQTPETQLRMLARAYQTFPDLESLALAPNGQVTLGYPDQPRADVAQDLLSPSTATGALLAGAREGRGAVLYTTSSNTQTEDLAVMFQPLRTMPADGDRFWGFVLASRRISAVLWSAGLPALTQEHLDYWLEVHDTSGAVPPYMLGSTTPASQAPNDAVAAMITLGGQQWHLHLRPQDGWPAQEYRAAVPAGVGTLSLLLGFGAYALFAFQTQLARTVSERTSSLIAANGALSREVDERRTAESALATMHHTLELRVQDRTEALERRQQISELLGEVLEVINQGAPLERVLDVIADRGVAIFQAPGIAICLKDPASGEVVPTVTRGVAPAVIQGALHFTHDSRIGLALKAQRPFTEPDLPARLDQFGDTYNPEFRASIATLAAEFPSLMVAPLVLGGRVMGLLGLFYQEHRNFTVDDLNAASALSHHVSLSVHTAELQASSVRRRDMAEALRDIMSAISGGAPQTTVLQQIVDATRALLGAGEVLMLRLDESADELTVLSLAGDQDIPLLPIPAHGSSTARALALRQPDVVQDLALALRQQHYAHFPPSVQRAMSEMSVSLHTLLTVPLFVGGRPWGAICSFLPNRNAVTDEVLRLADALAGQVSLALEHAQLQANAGRRQAAAEDLRDTLNQLNRGSSREEVVRFTVLQMRRLLDAQAVTFHSLGSDGSTLEPGFSTGIEDGPLAKLRLPVKGTTVGRNVSEFKPYKIENLTLGLTHGLLASLPQEQREAMAWVADNYPSAMVVPVPVAGALFGAVSLHYSTVRHFSEEELVLAMSVAHQAGLAIENAILRDRLVQSAGAAERERLARDLHDAVSQTLFAANLLADIVPRLWENDPDDGRRALGELRHLTSAALAEMRTLLLELRPQRLIDANLSDLLRELADAYSAKSGGPVTLNLERLERLPADVQIAFYRCCQEALNNAFKYAKATQVQVSLQAQPDEVTLEVADDGKGFSPQQVAPGHLGLGIMQERADSVGGRLTVESEPGAGTRVRLSWERAKETTLGETA